MKLFLAFSLLLSILSIRTHAQDSSRPQAPDSAQNADYDKIFVKLEIEAAYPGGRQAWLRFLLKNLRFPEDAIDHNIQADVLVQFIVDKEGNISDIEAVEGPVKGGLREEAVRVIKLSGTWMPGIQNGRKVKSYKRQTISFKLDR